MHHDRISRSVNQGPRVWAYKLRREIIRGFGSFRNTFLDNALFTCENHQCRVTDIHLTNITMIENEKNYWKTILKLSQRRQEK